MDKQELLKIVGGVSITATLVGYLYKAANSIFDIGRSLGSSIRRIKEGKMCGI